MSKIDELLKELCPDGVEWKTIKELFETRNGYTPSTKNSSFWTNGDIPWFKMEDIRDKGHILSDAYSHITKSALKGKGLFKANSIILATSATIGEHALITVDHLSNQRFTNIFPKEKWVDKIHMKFVYYYMYLIDEWCKTHVKQGSFAAVDMDGFYKQEIPIPPLSIQQEIVEVLDTFTDAISNLEEELALRERQCEYYRSEFVDNNLYSEVKLKDVASYSKLKINASEVNKDTYISVENLLQNKAGKTESSCCPTNGKCIKFLPKDILIGNIRPYLKKIWFSDCEGGTNGDVLDIRVQSDKLDPKYLFEILSSDNFFRYFNQHSAGGKMPRGDKNAVMNYSFCIPPIERQQEIVEILDTFEAMIANIKEEIALRTKQYEYYREKLLSFGN